MSANKRVKLSDVAATSDTTWVLDTVDRTDPMYFPNLAKVCEWLAITAVARGITAANVGAVRNIVDGDENPKWKTLSDFVKRYHIRPRVPLTFLADGLKVTFARRKKAIAWLIARANYEAACESESEPEWATYDAFKDSLLRVLDNAGDGSTADRFVESRVVLGKSAAETTAAAAACSPPSSRKKSAPRDETDSTAMTTLAAAAAAEAPAFTLPEINAPFAIDADDAPVSSDAEQWRLVAKHRMWVSSLGRVATASNGTTDTALAPLYALKKSTIPFCFATPASKTAISVRVLVAMAFFPKSTRLECIDGNRWNNALSNMRVVVDGVAASPVVAATVKDPEPTTEPTTE